ncbi:MAG: HEPN domain-containing protein [Deltaproteobacteria bacterium]|nr:HEPN domain-containing protein [Deltaproteobacteria bacterium]
MEHKDIETTSRIPAEWFKQAEYDMKTAEAMFDAKRYIYVVFMCHMAIEKAFKGLYAQSLDKLPPKTHNLVLLTEKIGLDLPEGLYDFVFRLNGVSVPTRYPEDIERLKKDYNKRNTASMLKMGKETLKWLKRKSEQ